VKIAAIVQARMASTRLPGKVTARLGDRTILGHVIARLRSCARIDEVVIATTVEPRDDVIVNEARSWGVRTFRGSESDVLERYWQAAEACGADAIVRATSDNPLVDPGLVGRIIGTFLQGQADGSNLAYVSYTDPPTYPLGAGVEIFTFAALRQAHLEAEQQYEREHVTPFIYRRPERFHFTYVVSEVDLSAHRWTVDTPDDLRLIEEIYAELYVPGRVFGMDEVLALFARRPDLPKINAHIIQKTLPAK